MRLKSAVRPGTRILEIEADPDIARFVAGSIEAGLEGCQVTIAEEGDKAIDQALALRPHAILTNLVPGPEGFEITRRLREHPEMDGCQIVMLNEDDLTIQALEGLRAGADDYIIKPFDPEDLLVRLRYALHLAEEGTRERAPRPPTPEDVGPYLRTRGAAAYAFAH
jgi:DNA-binding response OmpR family regulator